MLDPVEGSQIKEQIPDREAAEGAREGENEDAHRVDAPALGGKDARKGEPEHADRVDKRRVLGKCGKDGFTDHAGLLFSCDQGVKRRF